MSGEKLRVAAVLFEGFELLDVFGPLELFGMDCVNSSIDMLADTPGPVRSAQGPSALADRRLDAPGAWDVILVPGGMGTRREVKNPAFLSALSKRASESAYLTSVCTGSAVLAAASLLDGKRATTNKRAYRWVVTQGPRVTWVPEARWVEDGRIFTSSGVTAGMDMALALIEKLRGPSVATDAASRAEYIRNADPSKDPFTDMIPPA